MEFSTLRDAVKYVATDLVNQNEDAIKKCLFGDADNTDSLEAQAMTALVKRSVNLSVQISVITVLKVLSELNVPNLPHIKDEPPKPIRKFTVIDGGRAPGTKSREVERNFTVIDGGKSVKSDD